MIRKIGFIGRIAIITALIFNEAFANGSINAQDTGYFKNPIIPGFNPDPSICRVGEDYYLVTSSFEWFPGLPIYHSKDLVNWEQIGYVLNRPTQLQLKNGLPHSSGLWAPTIRYHNGIFYVINTATGAGGNFYVTSEKPEGPYSEPVFIENAPGIDPSLFFDEDDRCWYCGSINGSKKIPPRKYPAEDRIYIQELDLQTGRFKGERHIVTSGNAINSPYAEAPHIYKIKGKYYLLIAEGGTWEDHAVTVFTSDSVTGPYIPFITNPLLTHRYLGNNIDITTIGHADIVQTQYGDWYAVMLGVRPIEGYNLLGRETFLTSIVFQADVPIFNPGVGRVLSIDKRPNLPWSPVTKPIERDHFDKPELSLCWNFLRTPYTKWYTIEAEKSRIRIEARPENIQGLGNPSLIVRRVQHHKFEALCKMSFNPVLMNEEAGMVIMQNNRFNYRLVKVRREGKNMIRLLKAENDGGQLVAEKEVNSNEVYIKISGDKLIYRFWTGTSENDLIQLGTDQDATICSSNKADGFIGPFIGMYCSTNGMILKKKEYATFDWFEYKEIDELINR
jgi:xylan 1,4-beta-xylosidase